MLIVARLKVQIIQIKQGGYIMITIEIECASCKGTGLYKGAGERDGAAVVCSECKGTGKVDFSYNEFTGRKLMDGVTRVYHGNYKLHGKIISDKDVVDEDNKMIKFSQYGCTYDKWINGGTPVHFKCLYCPYEADNSGEGNEPLERCQKGIGKSQKIADCGFYYEKETCWDMFENIDF